jgi:hypothetical protein
MGWQNLFPKDLILVCNVLIGTTNDLEVIVFDGVDTSHHVFNRTFITATTKLLVASLEAANTAVREIRMRRPRPIGISLVCGMTRARD